MDNFWNPITSSYSRKVLVSRRFLPMQRAGNIAKTVFSMVLICHQHSSASMASENVHHLIVFLLIWVCQTVSKPEKYPQNCGKNTCKVSIGGPNCSSCEFWVHPLALDWRPIFINFVFAFLSLFSSEPVSNGMLFRSDKKGWLPNISTPATMTNCFEIEGRTCRMFKSLRWVNVT